MPANTFYHSTIAMSQADGSIQVSGVSYEWNGSAFALRTSAPINAIGASDADIFAQKLAARANTGNYQEYPSNTINPEVVAELRMAISKGYTTVQKAVAEFGDLPLSGAYAFMFQTYNLPATVSAADEAKVFGSYMADRTSLKISDVLVKPSPMLNASAFDAGQPWADPAGQSHAQAIGNAWANSSAPQIAQGSLEILNPSVPGSASQAFGLASTPYSTEIQQGYLAFFLRPADAQGYNYFANAMNASGGSLDSMVANFGNSSEYQQTYAGMNTAQRVNALYQNMFGRDAEAAGLAYWSDNLDAGRLTLSNVALAVLRAAQNGDAAVVANRIDVAKSFTGTMTSSTKIDAYNGLKAAGDARALMKMVTADAATVPIAKAGLAGTIKTLGVEGSVVKSGSGDMIQLTNPGKIDIISISPASAGKVDEIRGFNHDVLDFSSFGLSNGLVMKSAVQTTDSANFFGAKGAAMANVGGDTYIYVDANHDGNFSVTADVTVKIVGATVQASEIWF